MLLQGTKAREKKTGNSKNRCKQIEEIQSREEEKGIEGHSYRMRAIIDRCLRARGL